MSDIYNLKLAYRAALHSPDPSTQNGALLVHRAHGPLMETLSCNEFPFGVAYSKERWERPAKYLFIEHAERNSLFAAARFGTKTRGLVMVSCWAACADCARAIVGAGIEELVRHKPEDAATDRWLESIEIGDTIMKEAGVVLTDIVVPIPGVLPIRRDGELLQP